ncbi:MAG: ComEC/Rec2 family competence protein [Candidatus Levybacteria bacterium]|nr:ComEC/Rec2 family competence protein [Candidatus Levybacteria bacterium]
MNSSVRFGIFSLILLSILFIRFYFFYSNQPQYIDGQQVALTAMLFSEPQLIGSQQVIYANLASGQKVRIMTTRFPEFHYGDSVRISGTLKVKLLTNNSVIYSMYFPEIELIESSGGAMEEGLAVISNIRQKLISLFSQTLSSPSSSLLMGIIFGIKEKMPEEFTENLRTSGVFHVIAASGMNVTLIGGFISSFFALFIKRQFALALSVLGIVFYAVLGGMEASIIRASIMGILVFSAQIMGRQTLAAVGLFLAGFLMLFVSPVLIFDIGFQLSFAATLGILYIKPLFGNKLGFTSEILTTVAAQVATLPILLANFGSYSVYSILVNGLVLWTVPILMVIGGVGALIGLVITPLGKLIIYFCYPLLLYFESIVNFFGKIGGIIFIQTLPWQIVVGYYFLLSSVLLIFRRKNAT